LGFEEDFEFDPAKAALNRRQHRGTRFAEAEPVFTDPHALHMVDYESDPTEERWVALGMGALGRLLVVVYTYRSDKIRIISVRPAEPHERDDYEAER
jgi:uncharacterized DUF497 family protein